MRILTAIFVVVIVFTTYKSLQRDTEPLVHAELKEVLKSGSPEAARFKTSLSRVLPQMRENPLSRHEPGDHIVVLEPGENKMDVIDVLDRIEGLQNAPEEEGLSFARWAILSANYPPSDKEAMLDQAIEYLPPSEVSLLTRDILYVGEIPELYSRALSVHTRGMDRSAVEDFLAQLWNARQGQSLRDAVMEFAASRNLTLPQ